MRCGGPGYNLYDPNEVLYRVRYQGLLPGVAAPLTQELPDNARRIQILAHDGATFAVCDASTAATVQFAKVPPGLWIEIPPLCDRVLINGNANETCFVTVLHGPKE